MALSGVKVAQMCRWHPMIEDACRYVEDHATVKAPDEGQTRRLEMLAAAYAYRLYEICKEDRLTAFTAGDVRIASSGDSGGTAAQMWELLCADNADLLNTNGFLFGRIVTP